MSDYKVGNMIKLTRKALGMSQEELSFGICSVKTLSEIENGKSRVKKDTYEKLMERMGRSGEKSYSSFGVEDFDLVEVKNKAKLALNKRDYEKVEEYLQILKPYMDQSFENYRYIKRTEATLQYRLKEISDTDYLEKLEELLCESVPNYKQYLEKTYPFLMEEIMLLNHIANVNTDMENYEIAISIQKMILNNIEKGYIEQERTIRAELLVLSNLAQAYNESGQHKMAIETAQKGIKKAHEHKLVHFLGKLYGEMAWGMYQEIEKGQREKEDLEDVKKHLRQGHAAASLFGSNITKMELENIYLMTLDN